MARQHRRDASDGPSQRALRVGELIRHALSEMLTRGDVHDPVLEGHLITVPEVRMSPDLRLATVYVMPLGGKDEQEVIAALERNKRYLRGEIAHRVNLKFAPEIRFRARRTIRRSGTNREAFANTAGAAGFDGQGRTVSRDQVDSLSRPHAEEPPKAASREHEAAGIVRDAPFERSPGRGRTTPKQQRKRDKRDVHGWLVLDKPVGMTSTHAVSVIKRLFSAKRAGHAGTLDPLASGCLPIALGRSDQDGAVRHGRPQNLLFTVRWGEERDTDDAEGRVVETSPERPQAEAIRALLPRFIGTIAQVPPRYSAIKIAGERAYDLAREGEAVELESRTVEIDRLELLDTPDPDHAVFAAECGKGTYVRALARDMGRALGCFGHVSGAAAHGRRPVRRKFHDCSGTAGGFVP